MNRFRALRNRNYRYYFYGQLVSMPGTWMQTIVQAWLVYRLTDSAFWLGITSFCHHFTAFAASPVAGVLADRMDRRKLLIQVEIAAMLQAFALSALVFSGGIRIWHIAALASVLGVVTAFELTTRHALAFDLAGKQDLGSAIAINSTTINVSRVVGPSLAGILTAVLGKGSEGWSFFINGLSFFAIIFFLSLIRLEHRKPLTESPGPFIEAWHYVRKTPRIRALMTVAFLLSLFAFPYSVLLPVISEKVLHGQAQTLAWLMAASGMGAVLGSILAASARAEAALTRQLRWETLGLGLSLLLLAFARTLWLSLGASFGIGFFLMGAFPKINNAIQQSVDHHLRARVVSVYTMTFLGAVPLGSLAEGWLADRFGVVPVTGGAGLVCLALALVWCIEEA